MKVSIGKFLYEVHKQITQAIASKVVRGWKEDLITEQILVNLTTNLKNVKLRNANGFTNIGWDAFKLDGRPEQDYGDIAILVKTTFKNGAEIEGVAFLEAKRFYGSTNSFRE